VTDWVWARDPADPDRVHIRETQYGIPVIYLVEGTMAGYALCGAWLLADVTPEIRTHSRECARCTATAAAIDRGDTPEPRWFSRQ
jgi:hypothetical protein